MAKHGFKQVESYDPISSPSRPPGSFDIVTAYSGDGERAFHLIVNGHVMRAAGVGVLR
jgi:hypothetical protein